MYTIVYFLAILQACVIIAEADRRLSSSINSFSINFLKEITRTETGNNLICSPFSLYTTFTIIGTGAGGKSMYEMAKVFRWTNLTALQQNMKRMYDKITYNEGGDTIFDISNKVWYDNELNLLKEYKEKLRKTYSVTLQQESFKSDPDRSRLRINKWVEDTTSKQIKELFAPQNINHATNIIFVNVLYFLGEWEQKFDKSLTKKSNFYANKSMTIKADFMFGTGNYSMLTDARRGVELLELPYSGRKFSMVYVKPNRKNNNVDTIVNKINGRVVHEWINALQRKTLRQQYISIPKFEFKHSLKDLITLFKSMGIKDLFDSQKVNLSRMMSNKNLSVSTIADAAYVKVDEIGRYPAADTRTNIARPIASYVLDQPFLFFIKDNQYNTILYCGRLMAPDGEVIYGEKPKKNGSNEESSNESNTWIYARRSNKQGNTGIPHTMSKAIIVWSLVTACLLMM